jgi:hypothetical protein
MKYSLKQDCRSHSIADKDFWLLGYDAMWMGV